MVIIIPRLYFFKEYLMKNIVCFIVMLLLLSVVATGNAFAGKEHSYWQTNGQPMNPLSVKLLLLTDGLMNGYGLPNENLSINNRIIQLIGNKAVVRTMSSDGMTTAIGATKVKEIIAVRPHLVVLAIGINDAIKHNDTDIVHNNLSTIVSELQRARIYTIIVGIQSTPVISDYSYMSSFNSIYAKLATQFGTPFAPYILENIAGQPLKFQNNNIFPNADGAEEVAGIFVQKYLLPAIMQVSDMIVKNQEKYRNYQHQQRR